MLNRIRIITQLENASFEAEVQQEFYPDGKGGLLPFYPKDNLLIGIPSAVSKTGIAEAGAEVQSNTEVIIHMHPIKKPNLVMMKIL